MERRQHSRFAVEFAISISQQGTAGKGYALNLSQEGCLVESDMDVQSGTYLDLKLHLPDQDVPLQVESAAVRWIQGRVFGVQFLYMRSDQDERLRAFLATLRTPSVS